MKHLIILFIITCNILFAFEVKYTKNFQFPIFPDQEAILLETKKPIEISYNPKIYTSKGIVLLNYDSADEFVRNDLYFNGVVKNVKIALFNVDKKRYQIIKKIKGEYKNCKIKEIIFDNSSYKQVYFTPTMVDLKLNVILDCK